MSINTEQTAVVDLLTITHMSAFENNSKREGSERKKEVRKLKGHLSTFPHENA